MSFAKRISELGYELRPKEGADLDRALQTVRSDCSDLEKMEALGLDKLDTGGQPDLFDGFFNDHSIDIRTGELLGRYIAEERDSARLLRRCYEALRDAALHEGRNGSQADSKAEKASRVTAKRLNDLDAKVDSLCRAVDELRDMVRAQNSEPTRPVVTGGR